jgi:dTDP-4-amino-4,6-dideoxygalactose transaminase
MGPNTVKYLSEVVDAGLASDMYERFTQHFAELYGVRHCIGTPGCNQAVFAVMLGLEFEPGDEIIVSSITDYGSVAGMLFMNYIPVFADTGEGTALISAETIEPLLNERTRAIMCVNKFGLPCDLDPIMELAHSHDLPVIVDNCQAILSTYKGSLSKTLGNIGCFSFDSEKTCGGDIGGAILTDDDELFHRINNRALLRGAFHKPGFGRVHAYQGFSTRMPQCTAATCLANLEILERQVGNRQAMAALLDAIIEDIPGIVPYRVPEGRTHTYWMYGFSIEPSAFSCTPLEFARQLRSEGIPDCALGSYYLLPAALPFLSDKAVRGDYPFSVPPASRRHNYSIDTVPNARRFLETWVRWFWTEKYEPRHIRLIGDIIGNVSESNRR